jgi:hypothetical protein
MQRDFTIYLVLTHSQIQYDNWRAMNLNRISQCIYSVDDIYHAILRGKVVVVALPGWERGYSSPTTIKESLANLGIKPVTIL